MRFARRIVKPLLAALAGVALLPGGPGLAAETNAPPSMADFFLAARRTNAALLRHYSWMCRTEVLEDGVPQDTRVESVTWGSERRPRYTLVDDRSNPLPRSFVRRQAA